MHTGQRSKEFPRLSDVNSDEFFRRTNGWSDKQRSLASFYEQAAQLRQAIGELPATSKMQQRSAAARARALAHRPLTMHEVLYAAEAMGIDPIENPELVFLAESALCLELPLGWARVELPDLKGSERVPSAAAFFKSPLLRLSQWQHPHLTYLLAIAKALTAADAEAVATGEADAPPVSI